MDSRGGSRYHCGPFISEVASVQPGSAASTNLLPNEVIPVSDIANLQELIGNTPLVQLRTFDAGPCELFHQT